MKNSFTPLFWLVLLFSEIQPRGLRQSTASRNGSPCKTQLNPYKQQTGSLYMSHSGLRHSHLTLTGSWMMSAGRKVHGPVDWHQFIPNEGAEPTYPTEMNIQYDDHYLMLLCAAFHGQPDKIPRIPGNCDEFNGDMLCIMFDSHPTTKPYFEFMDSGWVRSVQIIDLILSTGITYGCRCKGNRNIWKIQHGR